MKNFTLNEILKQTGETFVMDQEIPLLNML